MAKSAAAVYAQMRRDNEIEARNTLLSMIPVKYFTPELNAAGEYNMSTKVFIAVKAYLQDEQSHQRATDRFARNQQTSSATPEHTPFTISLGSTVEGLANEQIQQLRQVASRLVQKAEEKLQAGNGMSRELIDVIDTANNLMIDTIYAIEQTS